MTKNLGGRFVLVPAIAIICAIPAWAQKNTFNPSVSVGVGYTDNVNYDNVDDPSGDESDTSAALGVRLPYRRDMRTGEFSLAYEASMTFYQDDGDLDNFAQRLSMDYFHETRRESRFTAQARYVSTEEQFDSILLPGSIEADDPLIGPGDDVDLSVTGRTERETVDVVLGYGWRLGPRWRMGAALNAGTASFEGGQNIEDRTRYGASLNVRTDLTQRSSFQVEYSYTEVDLDVSGDEEIQRASLDYRFQMTRALLLETRLGAYEVESVETGETESGTYGAISLQFNEGLVAGPVRFGFGAGVSPSGGGALVGSALNTRVGVSMTGVRVTPWDWGLYATYNHRDPFESGLEESDATVLRAELERKMRRWGVRFATSWVDQSSDDSTLEVSYTRATLSLVAYPLGGTRLAGI